METSPSILTKSAFRTHSISYPQTSGLGRTPSPFLLGLILTFTPRQTQNQLMAPPPVALVTSHKHGRWLAERRRECGSGGIALIELLL